MQKIKAEEIVSVWIACPKMTTRPGPEYRSKSETYLIRQIGLGFEPEIKSAHRVGARRSLVLRLFQNYSRLPSNHFYFNAAISILRCWINCLELNFITSVLCCFFIFLCTEWYTMMLHFLPWWHFLSWICIFFFDVKHFLP